MDKKILTVYNTGVVLVIAIISVTIFTILGMKNKPINICTTPLTYNMANNLLEDYCEIDKEESLKYISKKEIKEAYLDLLNDTTDVVLASDIDEETKSWLKANGIEIKSTIIAKDALVFFNNINNPINNLTDKQIRGIYSGKYTNWSELNGKVEDIIAYRAKANTEEEYMMEKFMENKALEAPKYEPKDSSLKGLISAVSEYLDTSSKAIAYTTFHNIKNKNKDEIKILNINKIEPTKTTIKSEEYKGTMNIYAIIRNDEPENSQTRKFVEYITSKNGQAIIEQCGYVNLVK